MSIQRKVKQFAPLVESGYFDRSVTQKAPPDSPCWPGWETKTFDHHATLRIDVARLALKLAEKAASSRTGRASACNGAIKVSINTTKERE